MLQGHFKLGTHSEYASGEGKGGLMDDSGEGTFATAFNGDMHIRHITFPNGSSIKNVSIIGAGGSALMVEENLSFPLFCAAAGPYSEDTHRFILEGSGSSYPGNPDNTAFLTLDTWKLQNAIQALSDLAYPSAGVLSRSVLYGDLRTLNLPPPRIPMDGIWQGDRHHQLRAAFVKPERFRGENEYRFAVLPSDKMVTEGTFSNAYPEVVVHFRNAIVDEGSDRSRY